MPRDRANSTPDVERVDVSMLSETQRDMLWMRLRGDDVTYVFDGVAVTVPVASAARIADALVWVTTEVWSPPRGYYPPLHPFQRTVAPHVIVAARWRRLTAFCIDTVLLGTVSAAARAVSVPGWLLIILNAAYVIGATRLWGQTAGKFVTQIRVVDVTGRGAGTGGAGRGGAGMEGVGWLQSLVRWAPIGYLGIVSGVVGETGWFLVLVELAIYTPALWDTLGRGLHDRLARTMVISIN